MSISKKLAFIGAGRMAENLVYGLVRSKTVSQEDIILNDINDQRLKTLSDDLNIETTLDATETVKKSTIIILAIKPQILKEVVLNLAPVLNTEQHIIVSIAAGISVDKIQNWIGKPMRIIRAMPNLPVAVQAGVTALYANELMPSMKTAKQEIQSIFEKTGKTIWLSNEALIDVITPISGSGPALIYLLIELLEKFSRENGIASEVSKEVALQTVFGALKLAITSDIDVTTLKQLVTSSKGVTETMLEYLKKNGLEQLILNALSIGRNCSGELSKSYE